MNTETAPAVTQEAQASDVNQQLASLQAELVTLRAKVNAKDSTVKLPVSDEAFERAMEVMEKDNSDSLASGNPTANASLSLTKAFGHGVDMTDKQKAKWKPFSQKWKDAFSQAHRKLVPERLKLITRTIHRNPAALVSTSGKVRQDGTTQLGSVAVREKAKSKKVKVKGKGKGAAKPSQMAGHVPAAGNAAEPAKIA